MLMEVYEDGPAAAANLRAGDVILDINGEPVYSQRQALLISASTSPGDTVDVLGIRDGMRFRDNGHARRTSARSRYTTRRIEAPSCRSFSSMRS